MAGPTIIAKWLTPTVVRMRNNLPKKHVGFGVNHTTTHYHGAHCEARSDGFPEQGMSPNPTFDPIVLPVKVPNAQVQPGNILTAMDQIRYLADPAPHMTIGLSNLSQGTSERSLINRVFLAMAISRGLDSAIVDVFDKALINVVATAEMLMNKQIYSDSFLRAYRHQAGRQR